MTLLSVLQAELAFGMTPLLDAASLTVTEGERIGFIGRNGSGKSSLLSAIAGRLTLDGGEVRRRDGLKVVFVEQEPELPPAQTLVDSLIARAGPGALEHQGEDWRGRARLNEYLHRFSLDGDSDPAACSGGERKRAALALALALEPDVLLLDEPTNHLDLDGIERLEDLLIESQRGQRAALIITHDRRFLDRVATRIIELDRGELRSYPGSFAAYESRKELDLQAERQERRRFDKFWAQEEVWIRKGIEARRTRNEGRVRRLEQLRTEREARRERVGAVNLQLSAGERSGRLVSELEGVSKRFGARIIAQDLNLRLMRGDRLALIGPNGAGKSTLIKMILGQIAPDAGAIRNGTRLSVAFFDQQRAALDPDKTLVETIAPGSDWIESGGTRKHVLSYLQDFLFPPRRAEAPVRTLSGGERNRLLLARLFAQSANLLVLDEPTNDLDMETLELLESTLAEYSGTLLLVSHDRRFLDNIATQSLVAEGAGRWKEYVGGYSEWQRQRNALGASGAKGSAAASGASATEASAASSSASAASASAASPNASATQSAAASSKAPAGAAASTAPAATARARAKDKLGFKEQRELAALPAEIAALEAEQSSLLARMAQPDYHRQGAEQARTDAARLPVLEGLLEKKLARWVELDGRA